MLALLVQVQNDQSGAVESRAFTSPPVRIGRNQLNDLVIEEDFVSQWHGIVRFDEQRTTYVDLGSTNGTRINGERVMPNLEVPLGPESELKIGHVALQFARAPAPERMPRGRKSSAFRLDAPAHKAAKQTVALSVEQMPGTASQPPPPGPALDESLSVPTARAVQSLSEPYEQLKRSLEAMLEAVAQQAESLSDHDKQALFKTLSERFPHLRRQRGFQRMAEGAGLSRSDLGEVDVEDWLKRLVFGNLRAPVARGRIDTAAAMERVGALLETFSQAYVDLRDGYEQFGNEMALRATKSRSGLQRTADARQVLGYLLDWSSDAPARLEELNRAFADLAIHQVALLSGVIEGVRATLQHLADEETSDKASSHDSGAHSSLADFALPFGGSGKWKRFVERYRNLMEEDRFVRRVFGASFARAYHAVTGAQIRQEAGASTGPFCHQRSEPPPGPAKQ